MFSILDGREHFYQWDFNQKLIVNDETITEVHFCNKTDDCALVCEVYEENGKRLVNVPNILLQNDWAIRAYAYCADHTIIDKRFKVMPRSKPADYIYTETEIFTVESAVNDALAEAKANGEFNYNLTEDDKKEIAFLIGSEIGGKETGYELIETITLNEEITTLVRNTEPSGSGYSFTSAFVKISCPKVNATTALRILFNKAFTAQIGNGINSSWDAKSTIEIIYLPFLKGYKTIASQNTNSFGNTVNMQVAWFSPQVAPITEMAFYSSNGSALPQNMTFEIYGVRANEN